MGAHDEGSPPIFGTTWLPLFLEAALGPPGSSPGGIDRQWVDPDEPDDQRFDAPRMLPGHAFFPEADRKGLTPIQKVRGKCMGQNLES